MAKSFVKTQQITISLRAFPVGSQGPFTSGLLPADLTGYEFDFVNDATWPTNGQDVLTLTVEQSNDSGQSWEFDSQLTLAGIAWMNRQGQVIHTAGWSVSLDNQGS